MPVRLRITLLFTLVVSIILAIVCVSTYYFSYKSRLETIKTRLANRALTTARLLSTTEIFDRQLINRIDSLTTLSLRDKSVQAYNYFDHLIYSYSEVPDDTIRVTQDILNSARSNENGYFFKQRNKEVIAYSYNEFSEHMVVVCAARDEDGINNLQKLKAILSFNLVIGIIIIFIGGYVFSTRLLQPIKFITGEVTEISAQNLTRRIKTGKAKDEWHMMSVTLNELLNRLQDSFELQRRFISNASHELSTPLTAISGRLEIALQRDRNPEEYAKIIASALQDVQHMNKLTQTLLEFAKASGNKGGLTINLVRIDEILMDLPSTLQKLSHQYEVNLNFESLPESEEDLLVFGNADLLRVAISNIVSNACKYSPDHKAIVNFSMRDKLFIISIMNKGEPIPKKEMMNIFEPFYRLDEGHAAGGFGLGLSLANRILKLHKGNITVDSEIETGTIFTIYIPSAKKSTI